jgi:hypothetical protein
MKRVITTIFLAACLWPAAVRAQQVTKTAAEAIEGKIRVTCELQTTAYQDLYLSYSEDNGQSFFPCQTVAGDLINQLSGSKELIWDCAKDGVIMGNFIFRITCMPSTNPPALPVPEKEPKKAPKPEKKKSPEPEKKKPERVAKASGNGKPASTPPQAGEKGSFFAMPGITMPIFLHYFDTYINYSLMAGYMKPFGESGRLYGGYLKLNYASGAKEIATEFRLKRLSVVLGGVGQVSNRFLLHAGIGYGKIAFGDSDGYEVDRTGGVEIEAGTLFRYNRFLLGGGVGIMM